MIGFVIAMLFAPAISLALKLPFLEPDIMHMALIFIASILVGTFIGPIASSFTLFRMYKTELVLLLKENE